MRLISSSASKDSNRTRCNSYFEGQSASSVLAAEQDFGWQKARLQEELECCKQPVFFYPTFHCELDFIKRY